MRKTVSIKREFLVVENSQYPIKIHFEKRHNSTVSLRQTGIHIRLPHYLSRDEKEKVIRDFKIWAIEKIRKNRGKFKSPLKTYSDGQKLQIGNDFYDLKIDFKDKSSSSARLRGSTVFVTLSSGLSDFEKKRAISTLLARIIGKARLPLLEKTIHELNEKFFHKKINKILFKNNKSNWGSCSAKGNINISTRLLLAPEDVLEYVCIHELAHLIELNHSRNFWLLVERAMPLYKEKEKWLKDNGNECYI